MSEGRGNTPKITLTVDTASEKANGKRESTTTLIVDQPSKKVDGTWEAATTLTVDHTSKRVDGIREPVTTLTVDRISERVDGIHDAAVKGNVIITAAKNAMSTVSGADLLRLAPRECLVPIKRVIEALQLVKTVHPFIGVVATAFEAILTLEMKRRNNDRRAVGLLLKQADMLTTLFQLNTITAGAIQSGVNDLSALLDDIKKDIAECGNVIDTFSKQKFLGKFLRAVKWEDKLMSFVYLFEKRKKEIDRKLQVYLAVKVTSIATNVESIDMKVDMILTLFKYQTDKEKEAALEVERLGGEEACMKSEVYLGQLERHLNNKYSKESVLSTNPNQSKASTSLLLSIRSSVDTLIDENKTYFDVKLDALTKQLESAIHRSTKKIIAAVGSGPWKRVSDPDIRHVWQDMRASSSVKAKRLVLALHDYYVDRLSDQSPTHFVVKTTTHHPELGIEETNSATSPSQSALGSDIHIEYSTPIESLEEDQWCLRFLSVGRATAIAEAIDDDASGFIKIAEVNEFYHEKPPECSMLRWITFWAAGWGVEITMYHQRIERLIERLLDIIILPENNQSFVEYKNTLRWIMCLLRSRSSETTEEPDLLELIRQHMSHQEAAMTTALEPAKWEIDSADTVSTLLGPGRIEKYLYPLLYLTLRRHYQVFKLGSKIALNVMEFESATETIRSILYACVSRTRMLVSAFEQQSQGPTDDRLRRFAGGLFARLHRFNPWTSNGSQVIRMNPDNYSPFPFETNNIDTEEPIPEIKPGSLHYGALIPVEDIECRGQSINLQNNGIQTVAAGVQYRWGLKQEVHFHVCDGCDKYPITGALYQCLGCEVDVNKFDFNMCGDCVVKLPEDKSTYHSYHQPSHPAIMLPLPVGQILLWRARDKALEFLTGLVGKYSNTFACQGRCRTVYSSKLHYKCIQCKDYTLCNNCMTNNADEDKGHRTGHIFIRFSGEPLMLIHPTDSNNEISDQQRIRMLEAAVAKQEDIMRKQEESMRKQEESMKIQGETMRSMNDKLDRLMALFVKAVE